MNPAIQKIREETKGTPYEERLFLVGGCVRDEVMGRPTSDDFDIVLEGDPIGLANFLHEQGITEHRPVTYPRFRTAMVDIEGRTVEIVGARRESYRLVSRHPDVEAADLREDVLRRDFTINTLLRNLHTGEMLDLTGRGLSDIRAGVIRTPTDPQTTFHDDPLRMLRAVRFAVRLGFEIEQSTWDAIVGNCSRLAIISKERIRDEFVKIMLADPPSHGLRLLDRSGLLEQFAAELLEMRGISQEGCQHAYDVWEHTLHALESLPPEAGLVLRLAVLFHDAGKPSTKTCSPEGETRFYGHEEVSAEIARRVLNRLRFPTGDTSRIARLTSMHMRVSEYRPEWTDSAVKRLMRDAKGDISDLLALARADRRGAGPHASERDLDELQARIQGILLEQPVSELESPLNGREIMQLLGIPSGPLVKEIKQFLVDEVIEGRLSARDKEEAERLAKERFGR